MSLLRDEKGKLSLARTLLVVVSLFILTMIVLDAFLKLGVGTAVWGLLSGMVLAFAGWAAGPRIAQHLLPQIGAAVSGIGMGKGTNREPNLYKDDERGGLGE